MASYIHQLPDWPKFRWSEGEVGARQRRQLLLLAQIDQQHLGLFAQERQPAFDLRNHPWPFRVSEHVNLHGVFPRFG